MADGLEAIEKAREFVPNLVIMDIQLPNVSGLELIAGMKADAMLRAIPVLAVTAYAGKGDEERIRDAGRGRLSGQAGFDRPVHARGERPAMRRHPLASLDKHPVRRFCAAFPF